MLVSLQQLMELFTNESQSDKDEEYLLQIVEEVSKRNAEYRYDVAIWFEGY